MNTAAVNRDRDQDRAALPDSMRRDVRLLGDILGEVIRDSAGPELLADVQQLRRAVIEERRGQGRAGGDVAVVPGAVAADPAGDEIIRLVASWSLERAEEVARTFTVYFHLANLAEEHQRIRNLRERDTGRHPVRESLAAAAAEISRESGPEHLVELLASLRVHLVLTAHPTEARRRAVVEALRRISGLLDAVDDPRAAAADHAEARRGLREQVDLLWRTSQLRVKAMDPIDEVRTVMTAFDETLFRVVPAVYRELDRALAGPAAGVTAPAFLRFGSWVGADRDGNPFVTARVTRETATIQADHVLRALENATTRIGRALTLHAATTPPSPGLRRALAAARAGHPELLAEIEARSPQEPYRTYLLYAAQRISATRVRHADLAYPGPAEFLADLRIVQESLASAGAVTQARGEVQHLIWQAETFGFHLAGLEVRQHSQEHARALAELRAAGPPGTEPAMGWSARTEEVLATFRAVGWVQDRFGVDACHRYVVSFTRSAGDIAAVHELARYAMPGGRAPVLDVVPLFESAADLAHAPDVLTGMLALPEVAERLAASGRELEAMLGYSDSAKELGPASATLRLFDTQARLAAWAAAHDVRLTLFHGRGGALGRGGGPAGRAVLAQAPGSVNGSFKVTEQGEVIFARYGQQAIAKRHLEQVGSAVLLASSARIAERTAAAAEAYRDVAARIDEAACAAFRRLVEADGFADWFARISPLGELGGLRIGSRPARRGLHPARRSRRSRRSRRRRWRRARRGPGRPARDSVGLRLVADPVEPAGLVRPGQRAGRHRRRGRPGRAALRLPGVAAVRRAAGQRGDEPGQDRPPDRRALPGPGRPGRPDRARAGRIRPHPAAGPHRDRPRPPAGQPARALPRRLAPRPVRGRPVLPAASRPGRAPRQRSRPAGRRARAPGAPAPADRQRRSRRPPEHRLTRPPQRAWLIAPPAASITPPAP